MLTLGGSEGFRITRDEKDNYSLEKFETSRLVQDCTFNQ
jgi:hypothetical protein